MGDGVVYPSVFVVDGQQHGVPFVPPVRKKQRACWNGQFLLTSLIILALLGMATEGYFLIRFQKELAKTTSQVGEEAGAIFEKSMQERKLNAEKPAAHVIEAAFTTSRNGSLQWEHHKDLAFLRDMNYRDGSLVCIKPGYYYIYSKIQFMVQSCSQQSQKPFLTHGIYKKTPRYPQDTNLVVNIMAYCDREDSDVWLDNSFLGGIFHLEENEEVYVQVSHRQVVQIRDGTRSYFGSFMI
ncbi:tumor necrosis factor ligand superfamily member 14 [Emydura macquarii macquarii]|uniref:tumor necrosis factor ligand superfamily member 14 n=1 Tax=Emydura macquarii macquarii TaxID=1129001 RepID=UPI00352BBE56